MIVAIERAQFNYLFKHNSIQADLNKIYWHDKTVLLEIQDSTLEKAIVELDSILPRFEEDHEVILLEYDRRIWEYNEYRQLEFSGVLSIIPLSSLGKRLLAGKLNQQMKVSTPLFEKAVEGVKIKRSLKLRRLASKILLELFNLNNPPSKAVALIEQAIAQLTKNPSNPVTNGNLFGTLVAYNTTEGFIPEGNVEYLCKIAVLARLHLGQDIAMVQNGPFYKELLQLTSSLNKLSLIEAFHEFKKISSESIPSTQKIKEIINGDLGFDMFFVAYSFFAFRRTLNKSEHDLRAVKNDVKKLKEADPIVASIVMYSIGAVFSFDQLYESIHILRETPLLTKRNDHEKTAVVEEQILQKKDNETTEIIKPDEAEAVKMPSSYEETKLKLEKVEEAEKQDRAIEQSNISRGGIPVKLFKEFVQDKLSRKGKDILPLIEAYSSELKNGITFKWLSDKLFLGDATSGKNSKISNKIIKDIKDFFENNKVKEVN